MSYLTEEEKLEFIRILNTEQSSDSLMERVEQAGMDISMATTSLKDFGDIELAIKMLDSAGNHLATVSEILSRDTT